MVCPNKSSQEWIDLVNLVGETKAYKYFISNNFNIPEISEVYKDIESNNDSVDLAIKDIVDFKASPSEAGNIILNRTESSGNIITNEELPIVNELVNSYNEAADNECLRIVKNNEVSDNESYKIIVVGYPKNDYFKKVNLKTKAQNELELIGKLRTYTEKQIDFFAKRESGKSFGNKLQDFENKLEALNTAEAVDLYLDTAAYYAEKSKDVITEAKNYLANEEYDEEAERKLVYRLQMFYEFNQSWSPVFDIYNSTPDNTKAKEVKDIIDSNLNEYYSIAPDLIAGWLYKSIGPELNSKLLASGKKAITPETIANELRQPSKDIGILSSWFVSTGNMDDLLLASFSKNLKDKLSDAMETDRQREVYLTDALNTYLKNTGKSANNIESIYDKFIEESTEKVVNDDGEVETRKRLRLVTPIDYNRFNKDKESFTKELEELKKKYNNEIPEAVLKSFNSKYAKFLNESTEPVNNYKDIVDSKIKELQKSRPGIDRDVAIADFESWLDTNFRDITDKEKFYNKEYIVYHNNKSYYPSKGLLQPKSTKYRNPKYSSMTQDDIKFYEALKTVLEEAENGLPRKFKLNGKLPSLERSLSDKVISGDIKSISTKGGVEKNKEVLYGDQSLIETDFTGIKRNQLKVDYVNYIEPKNQSRDLVESILAYSQSATRYKAMNEIQAEVNMVDTLVEKANPLATDTTGRSLVDKFSNKDFTKFAKTTNNRRSERLKTFIDMAFFNIQRKKSEIPISESIKKSPVLGFITNKLFGDTVNLDKIADKLQLFTSVASLSFDANTGVANAVIGKYASALEAIGGETFSSKDWWKANGIYTTNIPRMLSDIGSRKKSSIYNQLSDYFDAIQGQYKDQYGKSISGSRFRQLFNTDTLFAFSNIGEHTIQVTNMIAVLNSYKVKGPDGNYKPALEAFTQDSNGNLIVKDGYQVTPEIKKDIMNKIHNINKKANGVYNTFDAIPMQRYFLGRLAIMFRKHIIEPVRNRWGSEYIDIEAQDIKVGFYRVFISKVAEALRQKSLKMLFDFDNMTSYEKASVKKSIAELSFLVGLTLALGIMIPDDDEEELSQTEWWLINQANRLHSDIAFYTPLIGIKDQYRTLKSPTAVYNSVDKLAKLTAQVFDFKPNEHGEIGLTEVYKRDTGLNKAGDLKWLARLKAVSPYINIEESLNPEEVYKKFEKSSM